MRGFFHRLLFWSLPPRSSLLSLRLDLLEKSLALFAHIWETGTSPSRGSSLYRGIRPTPSEAPPRLRGELSSLDEAPITKPGSSPLTRGTPYAYDIKDLSQRFIPAYAGNSCSNCFDSWTTAVHPRLRGELNNDISFEIVSAGSSPLTRGTQLSQADIFVSPRFIPAYAGNSLKQGIEHLTNSSKDFLSGKYAKNPETVLNHFKNSSLD